MQSLFSIMCDKMETIHKAILPSTKYDGLQLP